MEHKAAYSPLVAPPDSSIIYKFDCQLLLPLPTFCCCVVVKRIKIALIEWIPVCYCSPLDIYLQSG